MSDLFSKQEGTTKWGDEEIKGSRLQKWEPSLLNHTHRIRFLSPPMKKLVHFHPDAGYFECFHGVCCDRCEKPAEHRIAVVIFAYDTDRDGQLAYDANNVPILQGKIMPMIMTENIFVRLSNLDRSTRRETDGRKSLDTVDVMITVPSEHAKKYKKWEIQLAEASLFHKWAASAKSAKNPNGDEAVTHRLLGFRKEMQTLWTRLPGELARKYTEQQFLEKLGNKTGGGSPQMNPDSLPDVGDPTAALEGL